MGRDIGPLALTIGLGVVGGFVGGLFTAGAFSSLGASLGIAAAGLLSAPGAAKSSEAAPTVEGAGYGPTIPEFGGKWANIQGLITCIGQDKHGDAAGYRQEASTSGSGASKVHDFNYYLTAKIDLGRSMGGTLFDPDELFVDLVEIEDSKGRRVRYDRQGETAKERGFEMVPTVSSLTGRVICETSEHLRFYTGTAEQMPDPQLQNLWGERLSAGRGLASVVLIDFRIEPGARFYFTVRSATSGRREIIERRLSDCGIPTARFNLSGVPASGTIGGNLLGRVVSGQSAREICEKALRRLWMDFAWNGQQIVVTSRQNPFRHVVDPSFIGVRDLGSSGQGDSSAGDPDSGDAEGEKRLLLSFKAPSEQASEVRVSFADVDSNYEGEPAVVPRSDAHHMNALEYDAGEAMNLGAALTMGRAIRDEDAHQDCDASFAVLPGCEAWLVGDLVELPLGAQLETGADLGTRDFLILEMHPQTDHSIEISAVPHASHVYTQIEVAAGTPRPTPHVTIFDEPILLILDTAAASESDPDTVSKPGLWVATSQKSFRAFEGTEIRVGIASDSDRYGSRSTLEKAVIGELIADFDAASDTTLSCKTLAGTLGNVAQGAGPLGNLLAFEGGLLVRFGVASAAGYDAEADEISYSLTQTNAGVFGSDFDLSILPSGTRFALLYDESGKIAPGVEWFELPRAQIGMGVQIVAQSSENDGDGPKTIKALAFAGRNVLPLPPRLDTAQRNSSGDLTLLGGARSRFALDANDPHQGAHRLSEPRFAGGLKWILTLTGDGVSVAQTLFSGDDQGDFDFSMTAAQITALFGSVPTALSGTLALQGEFALGRAASFGASVMVSSNLTIPAAQAAWTDTGITLVSTDSLRIAATGIASYGGPNYGPNGNSAAMVNGFSTGALVGVVMTGEVLDPGEPQQFQARGVMPENQQLQQSGDGTPSGNQAGSFLIGTGATLTSKAGRLWLRYNDGTDYSDNTGNYEVTLERES